jgi:hypothetical protein
MLFHLVYVSTASEPMGKEDLAALLAQARARNEHNDITGMLLYKDARFIQLLEGQEVNVQKIFDSIRRDERHHSVELLWSRYAQYREFPDWTMGFQNIDELDPATLRGFTPFLDRDFRYENFLENSTDVHAMLLAFRDNPEFLA